MRVWRDVVDTCFRIYVAAMAVSFVALLAFLPPAILIGFLLCLQDCSRNHP